VMSDEFNEYQAERLDAQAERLAGRADVWQELRKRHRARGCVHGLECWYKCDDFRRLDKRMQWASLAGWRLNRSASAIRRGVTRAAFPNV